MFFFMLDNGLGLAWDAIAPDVRGVVEGTWSWRWGACHVLAMFTLMGSFKNHPFASQTQWPGHAVGIDHELGGGGQLGEPNAPGRVWGRLKSIENEVPSALNVQKGWLGVMKWKYMQNKFLSIYKNLSICMNRFLSIYKNLSIWMNIFLSIYKNL